MSGTANRGDRARSAQAVSQSIDEGIGSLVAIFDQRADQLQERLPSTITIQSFRDAFVQAVQRLPALLEADRASLFLALQKCADAGLKPDGEEAAIVMFGLDEDDETGKAVAKAKGKRAVFMPMVWGLVKLIRQAGGVKSVTSEVVYRGEHCRIVLGDEPRIEHERSLDPNFNFDYSQMIGAYAIVTYLDGSIAREWMNRTELAKVAAVNPSKKGPRAKWPDQMDRKAPLRRLAKRLPKSKEDRRWEYALATDDTAEHDIDGTAEEIPDRTGLPAPKPQPGPRQPEPPQQRQPPPPQDQQGGKDEPPPPDQDSRAQQAKTIAPAVQAAPATEPEPEPDPDGGGAGGAGEIRWFYPTDANGEPVMLGGEMVAFQDPGEFAAWLDLACKGTTEPEPVWQANLDTIQEVWDANPDVAAKLRDLRAGIDSYLAKRSIAQDPPDGAQDLGGAGAPAPLAKPIPPPGNKGPAGWQRYLQACEAELTALPDQGLEGAIQDWKARNHGVYGGKAIEISIDRRIGARIALAAGPAGDPDEALADRMIQDMQACPDLHALEAWARATTTTAPMGRWNTDPAKKHLFTKVNNASGKRRVDLGGAP